MPWDPPVISDDPDEVTDRILVGLADRMPGWEPVEGAPEVALAEELGREIATLNQATADALALAVAGMGETAFQFPAYQAVAAQVEVDVTLSSAGTVIPAGFAVVGVTDNDDEIAFELLSDYGASGTTAHLTLTAAISGDIGNGVPAGPLTIITATSSVLTVTATAASTNGADAEPIETYLDRLVDYLGTLRPGGVNAADLAALARSVPGVHRALAIDLYDPADPGTPTERTVTVFPVDETSHPVDSGVATQVQQVLEDAREVNFIIHVEEPTYTPVDIVFDAVAETGADPAQVVIEITAELSAWLTNWGATTLDEQAWEPRSTVRYLDAIRVASNAAGVAYMSSLTINGVAGDLALDGAAALPTPLDDLTDPSTVTGTAA